MSFLVFKYFFDFFRLFQAKEKKLEDNFEAFLESFEKTFKEEERPKIKKLLDDAFVRSICHIEESDFVHSFEGQKAEYFEANTEAEILDFVKQRPAKIKGMLLFIYCDIYFNELQNAITNFKPFLCDDAKAMYGIWVENKDNDAKYRMLVV